MTARNTAARRVRRRAPEGQPPGTGRRPRRGTSLVEILIAAVMLMVAVMGLLGASSSISQQMGAGRRQLIAASIAQRRLDSNGIRESWTVTGSGATRTIELSLTGPRVNRAYRYSTIVPCV